MTPTTDGRVTSLYGWRTLRGIRQFHHGLDIVSTDRQLHSIWKAIKVEVWKGWNYGRGNVVLLYYNQGLRVLYQHVNDIYVNNSSSVMQGDIIAQMGWSGDCVPQGTGGMHLHIEVQVLKNGKWVAIDPAPYVEIANKVGAFQGNNSLDTPKNEQPAPVPVPVEGNIKIGDIVPFTGRSHYINANAASGTPASAGDATVTAIAPGAKHPFHLEYIKGGTSSVYGWVDAADLTLRPLVPEPGPATLTRFKKGARVVFSTGYATNTDPSEKALHVAKKQLAIDRGIVGNILPNGSRNPLLIVSAKDGKSPICWCNDGDIRGEW